MYKQVDVIIHKTIYNYHNGSFSTVSFQTILHFYSVFIIKKDGLMVDPANNNMVVAALTDLTFFSWHDVFVK